MLYYSLLISNIYASGTSLHKQYPLPSQMGSGSSSLSFPFLISSNVDLKLQLKLCNISWLHVQETCKISYLWRETLIWVKMNSFSYLYTLLYTVQIPSSQDIILLSNCSQISLFPPSTCCSGLPTGFAGSAGTIV